MNQRMLKSMAWILIFVCGLELSGCSFFVPARQSLTVSSDPPGADVTINGENAGATPVSYKVRRNADASIMVRKKGYETATRTTSTQISAWGILDIIGGFIFLVPFFGLLAPGAWKQDSTNIAVVLTPKEGASVPQPENKTAELVQSAK